MGYPGSGQLARQTPMNDTASALSLNSKGANLEQELGVGKQRGLVTEAVDA